MSREQFIKERVKKGYSGRKILREVRKAKYSIGNDKFWELMRKYRKSDEIIEEVIKELLGKGYSGRQIGDELRDKRKFELSNDKLYKLIRKHRRFVCVKDNILDYPKKDQEHGIVNYPFAKTQIIELLENRFFGVHSVCEDFKAVIYIGNNREEELTFAKLKFLYHLILTKTVKLKLREGCCEGGTELENFTLQLAFKYDEDYVFDNRNLCKKLLYDILEILHNKNCVKDDEEALKEWFEYLKNYLKEVEVL